MKHDDFGKKLPSVRIRSYETRERYGIVWFFPGDQALAKVRELANAGYGAALRSGLEAAEGEPVDAGDSIAIASPKMDSGLGSSRLMVSLPEFRALPPMRDPRPGLLTDFRKIFEEPAESQGPWSWPNSQARA